MRHCSISQLKKFNVSPATWAGEYILGIKEFSASESTIAGILVEKYYTEWNCAPDDKVFEKVLLEQIGDNIIDVDKVMTKYQSAIQNAGGYSHIDGIYQQKVNIDIDGVSFVGYADVVTDDEVIDIKTTGKNAGWDTKDQYSGMTKGEAYELQLWLYMKALGRIRGKIVEFITYEYKNPKEVVNEYEVLRSDELDNRRTSRTTQRLGSMKYLYDKFGKHVGE